MRQVTAIVIVLAALGLIPIPKASAQLQSVSYLGFDRNAYPGDANLKALRQTFSYTGYWLNHPPGEKTNSWTGHRAAVESAGFGFLLLFNGRLYSELKSAELKSLAYAKKLGNSDAQAAVAPARREGFPAYTIIFCGDARAVDASAESGGGNRVDPGVDVGFLLRQHARPPCS